jgi:hypothetical protein
MESNPVGAGVYNDNNLAFEGRTCKGNLAVLRLITQASKGGSKENI